MVSKSVSSPLSYLNSLLHSLGIKPFPAQHLLLAAANDPSVTTSVLSLLSDLVVFYLALAPPPSNPHAHSLPTSEERYNNSHGGDGKIGNQKHHCVGNVIQGPLATNHLDVTPMPDACTTALEERLCFVKFYLALWGYAPNSPLFAFNIETSESRHLLLALGWLISHCDLYSRALEKRLSLFLGDRPVITNTHLDVSAMESGRDAMVEARQYVAKVIATCLTLDANNRDKVKAKGEQLLMMCGHLGMTLRSLYALISCKTKRSHELNQMQVLHNVKGPEGHPFSPFELHLLEHQQTLEKYLMTLEMAKRMIKEQVECNRQERDFWRWMGEVAAEARQRKPIIRTDPELETTSGLFETSLLQILTYLGNDFHGKFSAQVPSQLQAQALTSEGHENSKRGAREEDGVSTPVVAMWKDYQERESRARTMGYLGTNEHNEVSNSQLVGIFSSLRGHLIPREESCQSQEVRCLDWKTIKSVKEIATMLVSILAKIRMKNRSIIQEALKISMANENHVFAGV